MLCHLLRILVNRCESTRVIFDVRCDDRSDLIWRARDVRRADAVICLHDRNREAIRRIHRDVDVVHALEIERLGDVDFDDDLVCALHIGSRVAERCRRDDIAVFIDGAGFDDSNIEMSEIAAARELRGFGKVQVEVINGTIVDFLAQHCIRLIRKALLDAVNLSECVVELRTRRCARPKVDGEGFLLHALHKGKRYSLCVSRSREAARRDVHVRLDDRCCFFCRDDLCLERFIAHAIRNVNHQKILLIDTGTHLKSIQIGTVIAKDTASISALFSMGLKSFLFYGRKVSNCPADMPFTGDSRYLYK